MQCTNPVNLGRTKRSGPLIHEERGLVVPCGKCFACRIKKRREWSLRLYHELEMWDDAQFTTLTYADDSIPGSEGLPSLRKRDYNFFSKGYGDIYLKKEAYDTLRVVSMGILLAVLIIMLLYTVSAYCLMIERLL